MLRTNLERLDLRFSTTGPSSFLVQLNDPISFEVKDLGEPSFALWGVIAPCPLQHREELFLLLMRANFLQQGTAMSRLGLSEERLTLTSCFQYEMDPGEFYEVIESFANHFTYWKEEVARFEKLHEEPLI